MANTTGRKFGGRQKGTPNKTTRQVKEALIEAFERLGGIDSLVEWGKDNREEFYKLWVKVLPAQLNDTVEVTDKKKTIRITRAVREDDND